MSKQAPNLVVSGRITSVYGVRGWVKVHSFTEPQENILNYSQWWLKRPKTLEPLVIDAGRRHGKGLVVHIAGCDDREEAKAFCGHDIAVNSGEFPELESGEFYWHQLEGLQVYNEYNGERTLLGRVHHLLETGSNDVLVVRGCQGSLDRKERLIPYLEDQVVLNVNLHEGTLDVSWDPEF